MSTVGQFLSPKRQRAIKPTETANRSLVGFAENYPDGLVTGKHSHPRVQLLHAVSGVMSIETIDACFVIPPGTALVIPADTEHSICMKGPVEMRSLFVKESDVYEIGKKTLVFSVSMLLKELIIAACAEPLDWDLKGRGYHIAALILDEVKSCEALPFTLPMPTSESLKAVLYTLQANPIDTRSIEYWADEANVSSRSFARKLRAQTGLSFRQWRQQARLIHALSQLIEGVTPTRAAHSSGFKSVPAFGVAFKKQFAMTPGVARKLYKEPQFNSVRVLDLDNEIETD